MAVSSIATNVRMIIYSTQDLMRSLIVLAFLFKGRKDPFKRRLMITTMNYLMRPMNIIIMIIIFGKDMRVSPQSD